MESATALTAEQASIGNDPGRPHWAYGSDLSNESAPDKRSRKLSQAAGLSAVLCGHSFACTEDAIKADVLWLLHDTICEALHCDAVA